MVITMNGQLFVISGPSGSGKDTLIRELLKTNPELRLSVSAITRAPREPSDYEKYHFVSVEEFNEMIANDKLFEYNEYLGNFYGTPCAPVDNWLKEGRDVILEIDVNGKEKVREKAPEAVSVFILPPSMAVLKERLLSRNTENEETARTRLAEAVSEIRRAGDYDYIVVNDDLTQAVACLSAIIAANRQRTARLREKLTEVLKDA